MDKKVIPTDEGNESSRGESREITPAVIYSDNENMVEEVRELNNVKYYFALSGNSPENTSKTLNAFQHKVLLITGGNDENISYDSLGETLVAKVKHLILIGPTSPLIEMGLMRRLVGKNQGIDVRITHCSTLKQAVDCAYLSSKPYDSILLSPTSNCISDLYDELKEMYTKYVDAL